MKNYLSLAFLALFSAAPLMAAERFDDLEVIPQHEREAYTAQLLAGMSQHDLDILYATLDSGAMPQGEYKGTVVFDDSEANEVERILAIVSPYGHLESIVKKLGVSIWKGKIFDNATSSLTNRIGILKQYPAHVFCGQSLLDSRRESIVLDYNYAENLPNYNPLIDWTMTRKGLGIRDEIRMVHPGLYLGRAYIKGTFALNFILERQDSAGPEAWQSVCRK